MTRSVFRPGTMGEDNRANNGLFLVSVILMWGLGIFTLLITTTDIAQRFFGEGRKYHFVIRQLFFSGIGFVLFFVSSVVPLKFVRKALGILVIISLFLCCLPVIGLGTESHGAPRWVNIPLVGRFQPSEFAKPVVILFLANIIDKSITQGYFEEKNAGWYPAIGLLLFCFVIILQKDLSTAILIMFVGILILYTSGAKLGWLFPVIGFGFAFAIFFICTEPYRLNRLIAFLKPGEYTMTLGYQRTQSDFVISAGGLWGNGLGTGMTSLNIPEIQTDYIFSGWTNAMGLLGVGAYLLLVGFFSWRGFLISRECKNRFACYVSFGCTLMILVQSIVNVGVVSGLLPTTGIPLPFFSSGGSSLFSTFIMCGLILNACNSDQEEPVYANNKMLGNMGD